MGRYDSLAIVLLALRVVGNCGGSRVEPFGVENITEGFVDNSLINVVSIKLNDLCFPRAFLNALGVVVEHKIPGHHEFTYAVAARPGVISLDKSRADNPKVNQQPIVLFFPAGVLLEHLPRHVL